MHRFEIELTNEQYTRVQQMAKEGGDTPEDVVREAVSSYLGPSDDEIQAKFTPEVVAHLDRICAEVDAGAKTYTREEVDDHLRKLAKVHPTS